MTVDEGFGRWVARGAGLALGVGLIAVLVLVGLAAINVLVLVFVAIILASGLQPFIAWLRGHLPIGRGPTILLVYGVFLAVVVGMSLFVVPAALSQLERTLASLPPFFDRAREWAETVRPAAVGRGFESLIDAADRALSPTTVAPAPGEVVQVGLTLAESVTAIVTILTVVYFWLTEHARLQRYTLAFVPTDRRRRARAVWNAAETRLGMWVRGQLILMAAIGVATATAYTLLGVPAALLLGLIAAIAEAVPIIGPLIGAIPAIFIAATVSPELALIVAVVYLVVQIVEGNVLVPLVMRNTIGISPFLVILSVLIGAAAGGIVGALLAVPIAAAGEVLIEGFQSREVPLAQDPTSTETTTDELNAPDAPDIRTDLAETSLGSVGRPS